MVWMVSGTDVEVPNIAGQHSTECLVMDSTPEDMEAVQACLQEIDRNVPVSVEPAEPCC